MAFGHGKSCAVYVNGRDLSAYFTSAGPEMSRDLAETTTMGKDSKTFIPGLRESMFSADGLFDGNAAAAAAIVDTALGASTDSLVAIYPIGDTALGSVGYAMRARAKAHKVKSPVDGVVDTSAEFQGDDDADRVLSHHVLGAETNAGNAASIDGGAATTSGGAAHLHVTALTGTSITVVIQDSADNVAWATILTFTAATVAGTSERVATSSSATIRRYTRALWTGTFTATFHVAFSRKP